MKLKNLFFGSLACLAFAACSNDDDVVVNPSAENEGSAVMAVKISMPTGNSTRAWDETNDVDDSYQAGDAAEVTVDKAKLYFFDENGNQWSEPKDITNAIEEWETGDADKTIDQSCTAVLIFQNTSNLPSSVVAVLNEPADGLNASSITELRKSIADCSGHTSGAFVMSNAVYVEGSTVQYAVSVKDKIATGNDLATVQEKAKDDPVEIIVERVLARVSTNLVQNNKFVATTPVDYQMGFDANDKVKIVSVVNGWWLDRTNQKTYLMKDLSATYDSFTSLWWNDATNKRSYWANQVEGATFAHYDYAHHSLGDKYCYENTDKGNYTQLVVSANLYKVEGAEGSETYTPIDLIEHKGVKWEKEGFISFAITTLGLYKDQTHSNSIEATDLDIVYSDRNADAKIDGNVIEPWQAKLSIADGTYYSYDGTEVTDVQEFVDEQIGAFKHWNNGQTYYFTGIEHNATYTDSEYAIVRNHWYNINVTSIVGLGTPVPSTPDDDDTPDNPYTPPTTPEAPDYPEDPEDPNNPDPSPTPDPEYPIVPELPTDDEVSAVAAQIHILKYRVVSQDVNLDGNPQ